MIAAGSRQDPGTSEGQRFGLARFRGLSILRRALITPQIWGRRRGINVYINVARWLWRGICSLFSILIWAANDGARRTFLKFGVIWEVK